MDNNITKIIESLSRMPIAKHLIVFGSVGRGELEPKDVDVYADLSSFDAAVAGLLIAPVLALSCKMYGWVDPFYTNSRGKLLVRNDESTGFVVAKNDQKMLAAIKTDGVPLQVVADSFLSSPTWLLNPKPD